MPALWAAVLGLALPAAAQLSATWKSPTGRVQCAAFMPDGRRALAGADDQLQVWDAATGALAGSWRAHVGRVRAVAVSPDGRLALSGGDDKVVRLWDLSGGKPAVALEGHLAEVSAVAFSPDGRRALSGSWDKTIKLWDLDTGKVVRTLTGHKWNVNAAAFSPDGRQAVSGSLDQTVKLWDLSTGAELASWQGHTGEVHAVAFSPDGKRVLSGAADYSALIWDRETGKPVLTLGATHRAAVHAAAFSPDGKLALTASRDRSVRVWDAASGKEVAVWKGHIDGVNAAAFTPDGRGALSASEDGTLKLWRLSGEAAPAARPKPKVPPKLSIEVAFADASGDGALEGEERAAVKLKVRNEGRGPAYGLTAWLLLPAGLSGTRSTPLGDLEPGASASRELALEGSQALAAGRAEIGVEVREANGFDAEPQLLRVETRAYVPSGLELSQVALVGGELVKAGEVTQLRLTVKNSGAGPARSAWAALALDDANLFASGDSRVELGALAPGQSKTVEFSFVVNNRFKGPALPVFVELGDVDGKGGKRVSLGLSLGAPPPSARLTDVASRAAADDLDVPPASKTPVDPDAYAVVIGIERYRQKGLPGVDYAARDAQAVHDYLTGAMGFDEKNVVLMQNEQATKTDMEKTLGPWLANRVTPKSRVFVFYAGHGAPDPATGEAFLIPYEGDPSYTEITAYPLKRLYKTLAGLPSKDVTVVLDSCFSGQGQRSLLAKGARPLVAKSDQSSSVGENTVLITATGGDQISTYYPEGRHGLLTYHLLMGLRGGADADKDAKVTTAELFGYLAPAVERDARRQNVSQVPTMTPAPNALGSRGSRVWLERSPK